jgi:hypothetical protein
LKTWAQTTTDGCSWPCDSGVAKDPEPPRQNCNSRIQKDGSSILLDYYPEMMECAGDHGGVPRQHMKIQGLGREGFVPVYD